MANLTGRTALSTLLRRLTVATPAAAAAPRNLTTVTATPSPATTTPTATPATVIGSLPKPSPFSGLDAAVIHGADPAEATVQAWLRDFETNRPVGIIDLPAAVFNAPVRTDILHSVINYERDAVRQGTHSTKGISDVRGSTRKAAPQKGRGMARVGTIRAPQFRGGGIAHGPKPRSHATEIPRKMWLHGLRVALTLKYLQNQLLIVDDMATSIKKTREFRGRLVSHNWLYGNKNMSSATPYTGEVELMQYRNICRVRDRYQPPTAVPLDVPAATILFMPAAFKGTNNLLRAGGRLNGLEFMEAKEAEVYAIMRNELLVMDRAAVELLHEKLKFQ
ncbi:54S ribosomal protein yml6, mitochondrial [Tieghemiomyces parasiticus]|uniref:Large ribosomal subunit protein uL4m n=1 Tax=Tieghemiomyces parasiticus TaxID=78921 RepID=A0A9W8DHR6_9FUNG|nr:54S ribosomal protein yml6, mitochondrial [Tieghemiomyces parasiticus]